MTTTAKITKAGTASHTTAPPARKTKHTKRIGEDELFEGEVQIHNHQQFPTLPDISLETFNALVRDRNRLERETDTLRRRLSMQTSPDMAKDASNKGRKPVKTTSNKKPRTAGLTASKANKPLSTNHDEYQAPTLRETQQAPEALELEPNSNTDRLISEPTRNQTYSTGEHSDDGYTHSESAPGDDDDDFHDDEPSDNGGDPDDDHSETSAESRSSHSSASDNGSSVTPIVNQQQAPTASVTPAPLTAAPLTSKRMYNHRAQHTIETANTIPWKVTLGKADTSIFDDLYPPIDTRELTKTITDKRRSKFCERLYRTLQDQVKTESSAKSSSTQYRFHISDYFDTGISVRTLINKLIPVIDTCDKLEALNAYIYGLDLQAPIRSLLSALTPDTYALFDEKHPEENADLRLYCNWLYDEIAARDQTIQWELLTNFNDGSPLKQLIRSNETSMKTYLQNLTKFLANTHYGFLRPTDGSYLRIARALFFTPRLIKSDQLRRAIQLSPESPQKVPRRQWLEHLFGYQSAYQPYHVHLDNRSTLFQQYIDIFKHPVQGQLSNPFQGIIHKHTKRPLLLDLETIVLIFQDSGLDQLIKTQDRKKVTRNQSSDIHRSDCKALQTTPSNSRNSQRNNRQPTTTSSTTSFLTSSSSATSASTKPSYFIDTKPEPPTDKEKKPLPKRDDQIQQTLTDLGLFTLVRQHRDKLAKITCVNCKRTGHVSLLCKYHNLPQNTDAYKKGIYARFTAAFTDKKPSIDDLLNHGNSTN